jgi:hypothetical protein
MHSIFGDASNDAISLGVAGMVLTCRARAALAKGGTLIVFALWVAKVETSIGRYKRVIGDALRSRTDQTEATEVAIAAVALNRMLAFGRPNYFRIA